MPVLLNSERSGGGAVDDNEWKISKLRAIKDQMHGEELVCPLLWMTRGLAEDLCANKLLDLLNFAPCDWDSVVCALVIISRGVLLGAKSYAEAEAALDECRVAMTWPQDKQPPCPLLVSYHAAMSHIMDSTWVMMTCLHRGASVRSVMNLLNQDGHHVLPVRSLSVPDQSAVAAVRSLTMQICHYTLWPSLMDERKPTFIEAVDSAACAMALNPDEGVWATLYARCLPWTHRNKSILLQAGLKLRQTPFTVIEYASLLSHSGYAEAVEEAANLCELAIEKWPESVYVNANYVTLFLNSNCRAKLSIATADMCLRRARRRAPDSPLLAGHRWSLRDVYRAGGHLSPILEEGEDVLADVGAWSPEKEAALLAIAARLYPTTLQQLNRLSLASSEQTAPASPEREERPGPKDSGCPDTLWSPKLGKLARPNAGNVSPSTSLNPPSSSNPSLCSSLNPSSAEPSPSLSSNPIKPGRLRTPKISGPLRRPRTPSLVEAAGSSTSSPEGTPASASAAETSAPPSTASSCSLSSICVPPPTEFRDPGSLEQSPLAVPLAVSAAKGPSSFPPQSPPWARARKTAAPTAAAPTPKAPTAAAPTVVAPTAAAPTAAAPTAVAPTVVAPTLKAPTAAAPTAAVRTAAVRTVAAPTAAAPVSGAPAAKMAPTPAVRTLRVPLMSLQLSKPSMGLPPAGSATPAPQPEAAPTPLPRKAAVPLTCRAQSRLDRIAATLPPQFEAKTPAAEAPAKTVPSPLVDLSMPDLQAEKATTATSGALPSEARAATTVTSTASMTANWSAAPVFVPVAAKSRLRPTAASWVPPAMRPSARPSSPTSTPLLRPRSPVMSATMRPVAMPTPPPTPSPPSERSSWSDFLAGAGSELILPPMEYKCPAQQRLSKIKIEDGVKCKTVKAELSQTGWKDSSQEDKIDSTSGFVTPPFNEGGNDSTLDVLRTVKQEQSFDPGERSAKARVKLESKFADLKKEANSIAEALAENSALKPSACLSAAQSTPSSTPVSFACRSGHRAVLISDDASLADLIRQERVSSSNSPSRFAKAANASGVFSRVASEVGLMRPATPTATATQRSAEPKQSSEPQTDTVSECSTPPPAPVALVCDDKSVEALIAECEDAISTVFSVANLLSPGSPRVSSAPQSAVTSPALSAVDSASRKPVDSTTQKPLDSAPRQPVDSATRKPVISEAQTVLVSAAQKTLVSAAQTPASSPAAPISSSTPQPVASAVLNTQVPHPRPMTPTVPHPMNSYVPPTRPINSFFPPHRPYHHGASWNNPPTWNNHVPQHQTWNMHFQQHQTWNAPFPQQQSWPRPQPVNTFVPQPQPVNTFVPQPQLVNAFVPCQQQVTTFFNQLERLNVAAVVKIPQSVPQFTTFAPSPQADFSNYVRQQQQQQQQQQAARQARSAAVFMAPQPQPPAAAKVAPPAAARLPEPAFVPPAPLLSSADFPALPVTRSYATATKLVARPPVSVNVVLPSVPPSRPKEQDFPPLPPTPTTLTPPAASQPTAPPRCETPASKSYAAATSPTAEATPKSCAGALSTSSLVHAHPLAPKTVRPIDIVKPIETVKEPIETVKQSVETVKQPVETVKPFECDKPVETASPKPAPRTARTLCPDALAEVRSVLMEEAADALRPDAKSWHRSRSPVWQAIPELRGKRAASSESSRASSPAYARTPSSDSPNISRTSSPVRKMHKGEDVPLWRRGGGDATVDSTAPTAFGSWRRPTTPTSAPAVSCSPVETDRLPAKPLAASEEDVSRTPAQTDLVVASKPLSVAGTPDQLDSSAALKPSADSSSADPKPSADSTSPTLVNCVCCSDCIRATFKLLGNLRPGPEVARVCLKRGPLDKPKPEARRRLTSRLSPQFLS